MYEEQIVKDTAEQQNFWKLKTKQGEKTKKSREQTAHFWDPVHKRITECFVNKPIIIKTESESEQQIRVSNIPANNSLTNLITVLWDIIEKPQAL